MRKLTIILSILLLLPCAAWGAVSTVTQANMRISAVDGTAFVDFSSTDAVLTSNIGKYLKVYDSTGKSIEGWIKAVGTGESLGSEIFDNPGFAAQGNWVGTDWSVSSRRML